MKNSLHVRLPDVIAEKLEAEAKEGGVTESEVVREVLGLYYGVEGLVDKVRKKAPAAFGRRVSPVAVEVVGKMQEKVVTVVAKKGEKRVKKGGGLVKREVPVVAQVSPPIANVVGSAEGEGADRVAQVTPVADDVATSDQIASVLLQKGTPEQVVGVLRYAGVVPGVEEEDEEPPFGDDEPVAGFGLGVVEGVVDVNTAAVEAYTIDGENPGAVYEKLREEVAAKEPIAAPVRELEKWEVDLAERLAKQAAEKEKRMALARAAMESGKVK